MRNRICTIDNCSGNHYGRGFCIRHYRTWQKHGVPVLPLNRDRKRLNDERLDELHRSDPYREFSTDEIAKALGAKRQTVYAIEMRALRKMLTEFERRGIKFSEMQMLVMLDTSKQEWAKAREELGMEHIEQLLTPLTRYSPHEPDAHFAIDNGAFSGFPEKSFFSLLERELPRRHLCRFVTVPDVVGAARRTRELFDHYSPRMTGWPLAYVCQDGQENVSIPWNEIAAIFIGGSNDFKESQATIDCIKVGKLMNKWIHVGRVNTPGEIFIRQIQTQFIEMIERQENAYIDAMKRMELL